MLFLTEDDIRTRCPQPGSSLTLAADERLTPSAAECAKRMKVTILQKGSACPASIPVTAPADTSIPCVASADRRNDITCLDAATAVPKSHPRIMLRGKLDTLLASTVLVQTQFDPKNKLSPYLKDCLEDVAAWIMTTLAAEVSGNACTTGSVGGMDASVLHTISRDPKKYLGLDPFVPSASMGSNAALLNWLRTLVREAEVTAARSGLEREDIGASLNRLSSAVYVLVLLTLAAENGLDIPTLRQG